MPEDTTNLETTQSSESSTEQQTTEGQQATPEVTTAKLGATTSLDEVLKKAFDEMPASQTGNEEADKSAVLKKNTTDEEKKDEEVEDEKKETEQKTDEADKKDEPEKGPVPLERFQEVNEKANKLEAELTDTKPFADAQRNLIKHCTENNISQEQFQYWMSIAAEASRNPAKALEMLKPTIKVFEETSGDALPADLAKAVADGEMTEAVAKRLAKAEAQQKWGQRIQQQTSEQQKQQQLHDATQKYVAEMKSALDGWVSSKSKDADFAPKKAGDPDGKFELVLTYLKSEAQDAQQSGTLKNKDDLVKLANKVYDAVTASLNKFAPRQKVNGSHVTSTKSSASTKGAPKSLEEAIADRLQSKHGISWTPPTIRK